jgi:hypothetical protein
MPSRFANPSRLPHADSTVQRQRAIEYSDWYARRLTIHRFGSYAEFPLFAAQYYVGEHLLNDENPSQTLRSTHSLLASGTFALFGINSVTGLWNLWDSRRASAGRTRRLLHSLIMLTADAGFAWTGQLADEADDGENLGRIGGFSGSRHRRVALGSMAVSTAGTLMMWFWKD